jgi:neutral ceramidase
MKTLRRCVVVVSATLAVVYVLLLIDWRGRAEPRPPVVRRAFDVGGPLTAGAARVRIAPPLPVVRAGYGPRKAVAESEHDPLEVRAIVLRASGRALAIVLADLVLVPEELSAALEARVADLHLDAVVLVATHTHSSVGGFDRRVLAQIVALGRYRADVVACLLDRGAQAVREAARQSEPVHAWTVEARLDGWAENRSTPGGAIDGTLSVAVLRTEGGAPVATLGVAAAHPTLFPRTAPQLSGDYPGEAMRRLGAGEGPALLLQGAEGDARPLGAGNEAIQRQGTFVAQRLTEALDTARPAEDRLGFADVEVALPPAEPQGIHSLLLRRPAANVVHWMAPAASRVTVLRIGDLVLLGVPGEPTALAASRMIAALPPAAVKGLKVRVVGLVEDYVGYVETPERVRARRGEARRMWFAPELLDVITRGLVAGVSLGTGSPVKTNLDGSGR